MAPTAAAAKVRLIPARAGNTPATAALRSGRPAHPRSRGEHETFKDELDINDGSSPLARGTRMYWLGVGIVARLIPARAGNTLVSPCRASSLAAHPRSRGEHGEVLSHPCAEFGSSPLARGTLLTPTRRRLPTRLIPARAGNTVSGPCSYMAQPAHPRSRGDHTSIPPRLPKPSGSSPLARGTREPAVRGALDGRLIPARAGNTAPQTRR